MLLTCRVPLRAELGVAAFQDLGPLGPGGAGNRFTPLPRLHWVRGCGALPCRSLPWAPSWASVPLAWRQQGLWVLPAGLAGSLCSERWPRSHHQCLGQGLTPDGLCRWGWTRLPSRFPGSNTGGLTVGAETRPRAPLQGTRPTWPRRRPGSGPTSFRGWSWLHEVQRWLTPGLPTDCVLGSSLDHLESLPWPGVEAHTCSASDSGG